MVARMDEPLDGGARPARDRAPLTQSFGLLNAPMDTAEKRRGAPTLNKCRLEGAYFP
jgi:hypothetical protein